MYNTPTSLNNLLVAQYDLQQMAKDLLDITGNKSAYNIFTRTLPKVIKNPQGLVDLLLNEENPQGFLQTIALETNDFEQYAKIALLGNDLTNEISTIKNDIKPFQSVVTEQIYNPTLNSDIPVWNETTLERKQRNENRLSIVNTFRIIGLVGMYEQSAIDNYATVQEIEQRKTILNEYYELLIENDNTMFIIDQVKTELNIVKTRTEQVLSTKQQNTPGIVTIRLERPYSAKMIAYELYGEKIKNETDLNTFAEIITGLNRSQAAHALTGKIKVVEIT